MSGQPPTRPADVHVHAVSIRLALGRRGGHGRHAQVGGVQVLLGPLPVVRLVVQVREDHGLLELRKGVEQRVTLWRGEGRGGAGPLEPRLTRNFLASRPSSPHSFWLSSMRAPSEEFFRGLGVTGPGGGGTKRGAGVQGDSLPFQAPPMPGAQGGRRGGGEGQPRLPQARPHPDAPPRPLT